MYTLNEIKADILSGKCTKIYYSTGSLWWTHLLGDVIEATKQGDLARDKRNEDMLANKNMPEKQKEKLKGLIAMIEQGKASRLEMFLKNGGKEEDFIGMPCDPEGANLYEMGDPHTWIKGAEDKPEHFGKFGLEAFMKAHHKNCASRCFDKWEFYNLLVLKENN